MKFWLMQRTWVRTKITVGVVTVVLPLELCAVIIKAAQQKHLSNKYRCC